MNRSKKDPVVEISISLDGLIDVNYIIHSVDDPVLPRL